MESVAYRSFLVRSWGRGRQTGRVLVEEVQSGRRLELRGDRAARLVSELEAALAAGPGANPSTRRDSSPPTLTDDGAADGEADDA